VEYCKNFKWDYEWRYCEYESKEIDPAKCKSCPNYNKDKPKEKVKITVKPFFRWYDLWVGIYIDTKNKAIYIIPIPMIGLKISY
jgi:hypothetical protein